MKQLPKGYESPRWSGEITDCSMPMTFDTYSVCSYNCLYCFSFFQKSHSSKGYLNRNVRSVNEKHVKNLFMDSLLGRKKNQFTNYIRDKVTMQWGGLSDGFDEYERQYGVSLDLLKFFDKIDYPLSISTKATWFTKDNRYMDLIAKHKHNWHFKISIITNDNIMAKAIERGVDPPYERLNAIKRLSDLGIPVTLRLRPYIIGISDDFRTLVTKAKEAGADSVTTEFFCLESRADQRLKRKYDEISKYAGYDIYEFYRKHSNQSGYRRLNYNIKSDIINDMQQIVHKLGMRFYVSDAHHKEKSDYTCCCATPPHFKISKGHYAHALQIAKSRKDKIVRWEDIEPDLKKYVGDISFYNAIGFNTNSNRQRAQRRDQTLMEYVKEFWNTPASAKSPAKYFDGVLVPEGLDDNNNIVYRLIQK
jgi:DNA repair photolyase